MRLATWAPEYEAKDVKLKSGKSNKLELIIEEEKKGSYKKSEIAATILGAVESFKLDYASLREALDSSVRVLDSMDELGIGCQQYVKYKNRDDGDKMLGELADFDGEFYETGCANPAIDTDIIDKLKDKKIVLVMGFPSDQDVVQYVNSLVACRESKKLPNLEHVIVLDSCVTNFGLKAEDRDFWAKYTMEKSGAIVGTLYRGETRIT